MSLIIQWVLEKRKLLLEVTAQQLRATGPWLDRDCHILANMLMPQGQSFEPEWVREWFFSCRFGRPPTQTLYWLAFMKPFPLSLILPPPAPPSPPHWHFGTFTHIFQAAIFLSQKSIQIKLGRSKVWVFFSSEVSHKTVCVSVCGLRPLTTGHPLFVPRQKASPHIKCDSGSMCASHLFHHWVHLETWLYFWFYS